MLNKTHGLVISIWLPVEGDSHYTTVVADFL